MSNLQTEAKYKRVEELLSILSKYGLNKKEETAHYGNNAVEVFFNEKESLAWGLVAELKDAGFEIRSLSFVSWVVVISL